MSKPGLNTLKKGTQYPARDLDSFVSTTEAVVLSTNDNDLFTDPDRHYVVTHEFNGFFEHSADNGEKYYREKKAYVVEKA
ncbi:hypothetical protein [Alteribacillus iranensis]|uniref:Uncharacterized protein n=1 Tax=Alteribacillus iranensis TaxID=930128 RepID=A0A1I2EN13_9BACI|nr:hypothetical protein [Alteribacillus iranensis]SFE94093.1 hypothetical protein SAMN05192532_106117 [Alteribacillus iranensis]